MTEKEVPINQTQFSFEEPIFANSAVYTEKKPEENPTQKPKSKKKLVIIVICVFLILLLLLLLVLASRMRRSTSQVDTDTPQPVQTEELGPFQKRIEGARELLELADPAKQDLAFPPVSLDIRLDPKVKD